MKITAGLGALVIGLAVASTAAVAQDTRAHARAHSGRVYNYVPPAAPAAPSPNWSVPLSPGGTSTGGASFGGPAYNPSPK